MALLILVLLSQVDPRFLSGAPPHAMNDVGPVDESPSVIACTVDTLRERTHCVLDGRPAPVANPPVQFRLNVKLARDVGEALCRENVKTASDDGADAEARVRACARRVERASKFCSLEGRTALLDHDGAFSQRAQRCYAELAAATQLALVSPESVDAFDAAKAHKKVMPAAGDQL